MTSLEAQLREAARSGAAVAAIRSLVDLHANIDARSNDGLRWSALHWAAERGHAPIVEQLIALGANAHILDAAQRTPLHLASRSGSLGAVEILLDHNANPNAPSEDNETPLHLACERGSLRCVQLLLDRRAYVNLPTRGNRTPLYVACEKGHERVVEYLLAQGADKTIQSRWGDSPAQVAMTPELSDLVSNFSHETTCRHIVARDGVNATTKLHGSAVSILRVACQRGYTSLVNELLQSGADLRSLIEQPLQPHDSVYAIPPAIARSGHQATLDWIKKATVPALKVIRVLLLGHERSGKTSILQLLRHTGSALYTSSLGQSTDADTSPLHSMSSSGGSEARERNQRALGIDVSALQLAHDTKVVVHDFCAPIECLSSLRSFITTKNTVFVVTVDVSQEQHVIEQHIRQWAAYAFDTLFQSAYQSAVVGLDSSIPYVSGRATHESPAALFQLIGTHSDKLQQAEGGGRMTALLRQLQAELVKIPVVGEPLLVSTFEPRQLRHALHGSLTRAASRLFSSSALRLVPARCVEAYKVVERIRSTRLPSPLLTHNGSLSGSIDGSFAIGATTNLPLFMGVSDFSHFLEMYGELTIESENEVLEIAEYLHDSASLVLSPSKRQVCSDMHVLSRLMLPYGYRSSTVLEIQVSEHAGSDRSIISLHDALVWIEKVCDTPSGSPHRDSLSLSWSNNIEILDALIEWGLCTYLDSIPQKNKLAPFTNSRLLLFPALRPACLIFRLPTIDLSDQATPPLGKGSSSNLPISSLVASAVSAANAVNAQNTSSTTSTSGSSASAASTTSGPGVTPSLSSSSQVPQVRFRSKLQLDSRRLTAIAHEVSQHTFDSFQFSLSDIWHAYYPLYSNGFFVGNGPSAATPTIGMVVLHSDRTLRVSVSSAMDSVAGELLELIIKRAEAKGIRLTRRPVSTQSSLEIVRNTPWSWIRGEAFVTGEPSKWKEGTVEHVERLGISKPFLERFAYFRYLTDRELEMMPSISEREPREVSAAYRFANAADQERHLKRSPIAALPSHLRFTILYANERLSARKAEFEHVRGMYFRSTSEHERQNTEVVKIIALSNEYLEEQFAVCYYEIKWRMITVSTNHKHDGLPAEDATPLVRAPILNARSAALARHTLNHLHGYRTPERRAEEVNLVSAWASGTRDRRHFYRAFVGMHTPVASNASTTSIDEQDQAIYLTRFASWCDQLPDATLSDRTTMKLSQSSSPMTVMEILGHSQSPSRALDMTQSLTVEPPPHQAAAQQQTRYACKALLLCHVLLGNTFPVTQTTGIQAIPDGYDSAYMLLCGDGAGESARLVGFAPDGKSIEEAEFDKMAVLNPCQVLPRYIVFTRPRGLYRPPETQMPVVLWVDPKPDSALVEGIEQVDIHYADTTSDALSWMQHNRAALEQVMASFGNDAFRIITNRNRPNDGGYTAGKQLLTRVRSRPEWAQVPILFYCSKIGPVIDVYSRSKRVFITMDSGICRQFLEIERLEQIKVEEVLRVVAQKLRACVVPKDRMQSASQCSRCKRTLVPKSLLFRFKAYFVNCHLCGKAFCEQCCSERPFMGLAMCEECLVLV